jgi:hypothetical protein
MPKKIVKLHSGRIVEIKSIRLANGNLLIPARSEEDRTVVVWQEVEPGTSLHKRWLPVAEDEPDPRES